MAGRFKRLGFVLQLLFAIVASNATPFAQWMVSRGNGTIIYVLASPRSARAVRPPSVSRTKSSASLGVSYEELNIPRCLERQVHALRFHLRVLADVFNLPRCLERQVHAPRFHLRVLAGVFNLPRCLVQKVRHLRSAAASGTR